MYEFIGLIVGILLGYWAYKDAEERDGNKWLAAILCFLIGIFGVIIWLLIRPKTKEELKKKTKRCKK